MKRRPELYPGSTEIYVAGNSQSKGEGREGYGGTYTSIPESLLKSNNPFPQSFPAGQKPSQGAMEKGKSQVLILCGEMQGQSKVSCGVGDALPGGSFCMAPSAGSWGGGITGGGWWATHHSMKGCHLASGAMR